MSSKVILSILLCAAVSVTAAPAADVADPYACAGEISPPLQVHIDRPSQTPVGLPIPIGGLVRIEADAPVVSVTFDTIGPLTILSSESEPPRPGFDGDEFPFSATVRFDDYGKAALHVRVEVRDELGALLYANRRTLYTLLEPGRSLYGFGDFQALELQAIDQDQAEGARSDVDAAAARRALAQMSAGAHAPVPAVPRAPSEQEQQLNELVGAPADGYAGVEPPSVNGGSITIQGNCQWQDENGNFHPVYGANIQIWDDDLGFDEFVDVVATDTNGDYSITVDNDDGFGAGDRDIYVRYVTKNSWVDTQTSGGDTYFVDSATYDETPSGTVITENFVFGNGGANDSNSIFQASTWIAAYVAFDAGPAAFPLVDIVWPSGLDGSKFSGGQVLMEQDDRYDWDTVHHEFGHYAQSQLGNADNPGGAHGIGDCTVDERDDDKDEGNRLAWGEGWPTYFGTTAQAEMNMASLNVPRVGDTSYMDLEDTNVVYDLEAQDNNGRGEDNEVTVQRMLWDLYDNASDGRDTISFSDNTIWDNVNANAGNPQILSRYWNGLQGGQSNQTLLQMGGIASDHLVGPRLSTPADGALVTPSSKTFSWQADVGCPSSYSGNDFDLIFYDAANFNTLLTIPGVSMTSYTLSLGELQTLTATTHDVLWAVAGRHTPDPATGSYLGENFAATVNQPPIADAGMDVTAECTSPTTTPVMLDGTGSSDPDGDALTYMWSSAGVSFDDATSAMPTGDFVIGTSTVTLTVDDGIQDDSDMMQVTVEDTTPPMIQCPADITVECSSHGGTPIDDPQLAPFFAGVSAVDVCDTMPELSNNAPGLFPKGDTVVTFTAVDDFGNMASCNATVTVEDTIPPEISLEVSPDTLWPPNHKMWKIEATIEVFDICDPDPDVELTSITSNEPDDDIGDGNSAPDIQSAHFGTDDREFRLRAERSGTGDGRVYTIVYTARDNCGNEATASATVTVGHNQQGNAVPWEGFNANGSALAPGATTFSMALPSTTEFDATAIDTDHAYVGNHDGVQIPVEVNQHDINGDGLPDLLLTYEAQPVRELRGRGRSPVSLYYRTADGQALGLPDLFRSARGPRLPQRPEPGQRRQLRRPGSEQTDYIQRR